MLGTKRRTIYSSDSIDNIILKWKRCDVRPAFSSFSHNSMNFYIRGRMGIWRIAPVFPIHVSVRPELCEGEEKAVLNLTIKPALAFYIDLSVVAISFLWVIWYSFTNDVSPIFLVFLLMFAGLSVIENSWQQDVCLDRLERIIRQGDG